MIMPIEMREVLNGLALCAGVGMLDEGLRAGLEYLGIQYRTVCYVEREAYAAGVLVARMEEGALDQAPVWSDLCTFDGSAWRGLVDFVTAGFPCQPHSLAGARKGLEDERWIWPDIVERIREVGPRFVWLENVPGLISTGGLSCVIQDLAALGFDAEWGCFSASDAGASQKRDRIFILAYRPGERLGKARDDFQQSPPRLPGRGALAEPPHVRFKRVAQAGRKAVAGTEHASIGLADANGARLEFIGQRRGRDGDVECSGSELAHPDAGRRLGNGSAVRYRRFAGFDRKKVAHPTRQRLQGDFQPQERGAFPGTLGDDWPIFAPGPFSDRWPGIVADFPGLAPAVEPGIRLLADGVAYVVDESRSHQLRASGNGVVAVQAAMAFVKLARRVNKS